MARILELVVSILLLVGMALLSISVGTNHWRKTDISNEGLFRDCFDRITGGDFCRDKWHDIDDIPNKFLAVICLMLLSILFLFFAMVAGLCSCVFSKAMNIILAMLTFTSVASSTVALGLYTHYYRDNVTLHWSYYFGWGGTGCNLLAVVFLLAILMR